MAVTDISSIPMDPGMPQPHLGGPHGGLGMVATEDYSVPDRMVGLSKDIYIYKWDLFIKLFSVSFCKMNKNNVMSDCL